MSRITAFFALFVSACTPAPEAVDPDPTPPVGVPTLPADSCAGWFLESTDASDTFGAIVSNDAGELYVTGSTSDWQLARLDPIEPSLTPVVELFGWVHDVLETDGSNIELFEFYPGFRHLVFDSLSGETTVLDVDVQSPEEVRRRHEYEGVAYRVGSGEGCVNTCLFADDDVVFDDADVAWNLHTNGVYFIDQTLYFMAYGDNNSFRSFDLESGEMELLESLSGGDFVSLVERSPAGEVHWLASGPSTVTLSKLSFAGEVMHLATVTGDGANRMVFGEYGEIWWSGYRGLHRHIAGVGTETMVYDPDATGTSFAIVDEQIFYTQVTDVSRAGCMSVR